MVGGQAPLAVLSPKAARLEAERVGFGQVARLHPEDATTGRKLLPDHRIGETFFAMMGDERFGYRFDAALERQSLEHLTAGQYHDIGRASVAGFRWLPQHGSSQCRLGHQ